MTLPADISRCRGLAGVSSRELVCRKRTECERYLALWTERDMQTPIASMLCIDTVLGKVTLDPRYPHFIPAEDEGAE